jgi:protein-arginine kinase activator protein McsA
VVDRRNYWKERRKKLEEEHRCKRCGILLDEDLDSGRLYCWICASNRRDEIEELKFMGGFGE